MVATSKMKVRNCTTGELFCVPPQGSIFPPKEVQFLTLFVVQFLALFSRFVFFFPIFGSNCEFLFFKELKSQVGTSVVQLVPFSNLGVSFSNIT